MRRHRDPGNTRGPVATVLQPIVHREGAHDAVLIKPAGLSVELPARGHAANDEVSLLAWARRRWPTTSPRLPHRLDRMARGIVVVALSPEAAAFHSEAVRDRRWAKIYLARVAAERAHELVGSHRVYLRTRGRRAEVVRSGGDRSELEILAAAPAPRRAGESHVLIRLLTGRYHQIRATLAHLGAPISADPLYDPRAEFRSGHVQSEPYLEHALLRLPRFDAGAATMGEEEIVWRPLDPAREPLDAKVADHLARLATSQAR